MERSYGLKWHILPPDNLLEIEQQVRQDLDQLGDSIVGKSPSNLLFHTVFLGESIFIGPIVDVWGEENDHENFHCEYREKIDWITLKDM